MVPSVDCRWECDFVKVARRMLKMSCGWCGVNGLEKELNSKVPLLGSTMRPVRPLLLIRHGMFDAASNSKKETRSHRTFLRKGKSAINPLYGRIQLLLKVFSSLFPLRAAMNSC
jgi:hypothetical protein